MAHELLSVRAAADLLGVHIDTVRRWTDEGRLPTARTAGGHRRIPRDAVERLRESRRDGDAAALPRLPSEAGDPADRAWAQHAVVHARYELAETGEQPWRTQMSEADRRESRENGQRLMGLLLRHATDSIEPDALWPEVDRLTRVYARKMRDAGMPYRQALQAALFFRDVLSESTAFYPSRPGTDPVDLVRKVNEFTNRVQLAIADAFDAEPPAALPDDDA